MQCLTVAESEALQSEAEQITTPGCGEESHVEIEEWQVNRKLKEMVTVGRGYENLWGLCVTW